MFKEMKEKDMRMINGGKISNTAQACIASIAEVYCNAVQFRTSSGGGGYQRNSGGNWGAPHYVKDLKSI